MTDENRTARTALTRLFEPGVVDRDLVAKHGAHAALSLTVQDKPGRDLLGRGCPGGKAAGQAVALARPHRDAAGPNHGTQTVSVHFAWNIAPPSKAAATGIGKP